MCANFTKRPRSLAGAARQRGVRVYFAPPPRANSRRAPPRPPLRGRKEPERVQNSRGGAVTFLAYKRAKLAQTR